MEVMTWIYIIMGVLASVAIFLYVLPYLRKDRKSKTSTTETKVVKQLGKCPVCGHSLNEDDNLFVEKFRAEPEDKIFTKGCNYCYDPEARRRIG